MAYTNEKVLANPNSSSLPGENARKSLITNDPWDCFRLESLLPLKETYRENTEFGFLLRHYWLPATILTFRRSSLVTFPDGTTRQVESEIERRMARCRSDHCLWRERITPLAAGDGNGDGSAKDLKETENLCCYNCYDQTYRQVSVKSYIANEPLAPVDALEARRRALYEMPILFPPGPNPVGFAWYAKVGDDYMNYRLDADERIGDTSVLIIRREGRFTLSLPAEQTTDLNRKTILVTLEYKGVSVFALHRSVVLEDRFMDRIVESGDCVKLPISSAKQVVIRLIRSTPIEKEK